MILLPLVLVIAATDRFTKFFLQQNDQFFIEIIPGLLQYTLGINVDGPLGLVAPDTFFFTLAFFVSALLSVAIIYEKDTMSRALLIAVIVGVISNTADRFIYGYVIDTFRLPWLIFNIADLLLVGGAFFFVVRFFQIKSEEQIA